MATSSLVNSRGMVRLRNLVAPYARLLPPLTSAVLVLVLAWLLAQLVWAVAPAPTAARWMPVPPAPNAPVRQVPANAAAMHGVGDLFGHYASTAADNTNVRALATAPETQLNLKLLGILANRQSPSQSRALIAPGNGDDQPYALGQAVTSGVLLKAIFPDRVVLSRNGKLETLRLDLDQTSASNESDVPIAVAGQSAANSEKMSEIRTQLLANPAAAAQFIRVQPVEAPGGGQMGYRIYPGSNHSAFTATGLHPGDIVTAINGVPLNNPAQTLQLLSELSQAQQVSVSVKRGSQTLTTTLDFAR